MRAAENCYIDGCRKPATYVVESYPDDVFLCDEHKGLHGELLPWERVRTPIEEVRARIAKLDGERFRR